MEQFRTFAAHSPNGLNSGRALTPVPESTITPVNTEPASETSMTSTRPPAIDELLTDKESRILDLIAQGKSNKQIAATVFLAEGTVKNYVSRIMDKLHASSRLELAVRAVARRGGVAK
jgi:DNA-binding NarL/FixJ family response regulator